MRQLHLDGRVEAPIERAYELATDPAQVSELMPWISDVREVHGDGSHIGDSYRFTDHVLGRQVGGMTVVTAAERPVLQTTQTTYDDGTHVIWTMHFAPGAEGAATDVRSTVWYELPHSLLGRAEQVVFGPFIEHRLREAQARFVSAAGAGAQRSGTSH